MILNQLVKITGLVQVLCNISINLLYIVYEVFAEAIPQGQMPRYLPLHLLILLCIVPGYFSITDIDDKLLKWLLLLLNLGITVLLFILFSNIYKTFAVNA